jgi:diadenosine tetraphosphatase ApaH/serine/threonine PP2A family protein phosphatase
MFAALACVHANLEALTAVLADIDAQGIRDVRFLGDVVGYGPSPVECVDLLMARASVCLQGHCDEALFRGTTSWGSLYHARTLEFARALLEPSILSAAATRRRWEWLRGLAREHRDGPDLFVHGSPREPTWDYIHLVDAGFGPTEAMEEHFSACERLLFVGHTHLPGVIPDDYQAWVPTDAAPTWRLKGDKAIVNVGSVGQPRDQDPRACYVVVDGDAITWRRVAYDVERTVERMRATEQIHPSIAERLPRGT